MFIFVAYKDPPELSSYLQRSLHSHGSIEEDPSLEKMLLVNPNCYVRVMLEFIRSKCKLAEQTVFDLCEENGALKNLFSYNSYTYCDSYFDHKRTYYLIVFKQEPNEKLPSIFPQLNHENKLYNELITKLKQRRLSCSMADSNANLSQGRSPPTIRAAVKKK